MLRHDAGRLPPGGQLPSVRELMGRLHVSPGTVRNAVAALVSEGVLDARPGHGTFVASRARTAHAMSSDFAWQGLALGSARVSSEAVVALTAEAAHGAINLSGGYPSEDLQAIALVSRAMGRVARRPSAWARVPAEGLDGLREWFARQLAPSITPHEVVITPGAQAAITTAFGALASPGSPMLIESPSYVGAIVAARAAGLRLVPVPTDAEGVQPDMLEQAFATTGARVFYAQPTHANPSGASLSTSRRRQVLDVVSKARAFLIEDDWCRDLSFEKAPPRPLLCDDSDGHCVYLRSLTKSTAPGLRIGAIVARGAALSRLTASRVAAEFFVSGTLQETALEIVHSPRWLRHLGEMRRVLVSRRDVLVAACRRHIGDDAVPLAPSGGTHLWVRLADHIDDVELARRAADAKVLVSAGRQWFPAEPTGAFLRLSYGAAPEPALVRAVETLSRLLPKRSASRASPRVRHTVV